MPAQPNGFPWPSDGRICAADAESEGSSIPARPLVAYVHVPFCIRRCGYCDFNTYTTGFGKGADLATYAQSVLREIELSAKILEGAGAAQRPLQSIFFGGGTPSLMEPADVGRMINALVDAHQVAPGAEVTLEANPETLTAAKIRAFADAGVNRISMGMQSAVPRVLGVLERPHNPDTVPWALSQVKDAGLKASVDLIYGAPTETLEEWDTTLDSALSTGVDHISAYSLIVEPGTRMAAQIGRGELPPTDPDLDADKYVLASQKLEAHGLHWYEISNFARAPADRSIHNLAYWRDWDWWGYGPGAHSHVGRLRWWNVKHPTAYAGRLRQGASPGAAGERLGEEERKLERLMLGIRTVEGISVRQTFDPNTIESLVEEGLVEIRPRAGTGEPHLVLTLAGRLVADRVTRVLAGWGA